MATITERNGRFLARVRKDGFKATAKTFTKRADATAWARRTEADMEAGRWIEPSEIVPIVSGAIDAYNTAVLPTLKGALTYGYWLKEFKAATWADKPIDKLTAFDLAAWRDEQTKRLEAGTVVRKLGLLSGMLSWCQKERGWITTNPMRLVRKPRVHDARDRVLTQAEELHLLEAAGRGRAKWLRDALVVLLRSAMRRGELWALKATDIDFDRGIARLADTKNGSAREVPLCTTSLEALRRLATAAAAAKPQRTRLLSVADPHGITLAFARAVQQARRRHQQGVGVPDESFLRDVRLHDLRHCAVTTWASTGALSLPELMAISGHKTPRMLTRYCNLDAAKIAEKMTALSAV